MAISDTINSMKEHVQSAYSQIGSMNGTVPTKKNLENLAVAIGTIKTGVDTSDATATANDILLGKTSYANGAKITGTIETYAGDGSETVNKLASLVEGTITEITAEDLAGVTKIRDYAFYFYNALTSVTIPNSATTIGNTAFNTCTSLTSITIPNSIIYIGNDAFYQCTSLKSITIPNSVTGIGRSVFSSCSALTSITLSNSIKSISSYAFNSCSKLTSITIPSAVTSIESSALNIGSSTNKATITMLPTTPPTIKSDTFNASYLQKIIVPAGTGATYKAATNWSKFADYIEEATA